MYKLFNYAYTETVFKFRTQNEALLKRHPYQLPVAYVSNSRLHSSLHRVDTLSPGQRFERSLPPIYILQALR